MADFGLQFVGLGVFTLDLQAGRGDDTFTGKADHPITLELAMGKGRDALVWESGELLGPTWTGLEALALSGGTLALSDDFDDQRVGEYDQSGGTLAGSGGLVVTRSGTWTGGAMAEGGIFRVGASATFDIAPVSHVELKRKLLNRGALSWLSGDILGNLGVIENRGVLSAAGFLDGHLVNAGVLQVGGSDSFGLLRLDGSFRQLTDSLTQFEVSDAGGDRVEVFGGLYLNGSLDVLTPLGALSVDEVTLFDHTCGCATNGFFLDQPEGWVAPLGDREYKLSYVGGTGNDVVLRASGAGGGDDDGGGGDGGVCPPPPVPLDEDGRDESGAYWACIDGNWQVICC